MLVKPKTWTWFLASSYATHVLSVSLFNNTPSPVGAVLWSCVSGLWSSLEFSSVFVSFRFIFFGTLWCETDGVSSSSYDGGLEEAPGVREDWSAEQVFSGFCSWSCEHTKSFKFSCLKAVFAVKWWDFKHLQDAFSPNLVLISKQMVRLVSYINKPIIILQPLTRLHRKPDRFPENHD